MDKASMPPKQKKRIFTIGSGSSKEGTMMHQRGNYQYLALGFQAIRLLTEQTIEYDIFLPSENDLMKNLSSGHQRQLDFSGCRFSESEGENATSISYE